ncbi:MAG: bifunctional adenosylcobinamide kinase/adenosylcobinamide-phosphate guanylyltransferase [Thermodesulfobacterium sp.]|jgi:adenosylcobinamide kinase/adenosylcobinamide-phosphate guanylyltransferase|nr:bifunctional adenosylcobinamide kinase/adenosylcobinamide-phosphate guanylyltransferase [Thermodesulfobacterium sp.]
MLRFIIGGIKSGKTRFALKKAEELNTGKLYYIATARAVDEEMKARIERHKIERGEKWITIEEPIDVDRVLKTIPKGSLIIIDCLTTWLTNLLIENYDVEEKTNKLLDILLKTKKDLDLFLISNEVGLGIIPDNPLGRKFIDLSGYLHQKVAQIADEVYFIICGCEVKVK